MKYLGVQSIYKQYCHRNREFVAMYGLRMNPLVVFLMNILAFIIAYYVSLLLHEWGHGTVAWLAGVKQSPFDVQYGGWLLLDADENVDYGQLINTGRGVAAALIGIGGFSVSLLFTIISFILLSFKSIQRNANIFTIVYWFLIINMLPMVQYLTVSTFSTQGDTGRFIQGLNIAGWWVFVPGVIFLIYAIWRILNVEIIKAYVVMPVRSLLGQNLLLLATLSIIFLFIYTHGYNPLTDTGMDKFSRILAVISIILMPMLFIICNPVRHWVQKRIAFYKMEQ